MAPPRKRAAKTPKITGKIIGRWLWFACLEEVAAVGSAVDDCSDRNDAAEREALLRNVDDPTSKVAGD